MASASPAYREHGREIALFDTPIKRGSKPSRVTEIGVGYPIAEIREPLDVARTAGRRPVEKC